MNSLSANKKILITIGSFALIVVFLAVGLKLAGSKNSSEEPVETTTACPKAVAFSIASRFSAVTSF